MAAAIPALIIAGTVMSAGSTIVAGNQANAAAKSEARQLERNSKATFAEGTRTAQEYQRQGQINQSNIRAQMAGSGGVTTDASAVETLGESGRIAKYNGLAAMYSHQVKADALEHQAKVRRVEGKNAKSASRIKALGTIISGASGAYGVHSANKLAANKLAANKLAAGATV